MTAFVIETISFDPSLVTAQQIMMKYRAENITKGTHSCGRAGSAAVGEAEFVGIIDEEKWKADQAMHLNWNPTLA